MAAVIPGTLTTADNVSDLLHFQNTSDTVQEFLEHEDVPQDLRDRIFTYFAFTWARSKGFNVRLLLQDLPLQLQMDIAYSIHENVIASVPIFKHCDVPFLKALCLAVQEQTFLPGDWIIRAGETGSSMYLIQQGVMEVFIPKDPSMGHPNARDEDDLLDQMQFIRYLQDGDYFGERSLLESVSRNASVRAITACIVLSIDRSQYERVLRYFPHYRERNIAMWKKPAPNAGGSSSSGTHSVGNNTPILSSVSSSSSATSSDSSSNPIFGNSFVAAADNPFFSASSASSASSSQPAVPPPLSIPKLDLHTATIPSAAADSAESLLAMSSTRVEELVSERRAERRLLRSVRTQNANLLESDDGRLNQAHEALGNV